MMEDPEKWLLLFLTNERVTSTRKVCQTEDFGKFPKTNPDRKRSNSARDFRSSRHFPRLLEGLVTL